MPVFVFIELTLQRWLFRKRAEQCDPEWGREPLTRMRTRKLLGDGAVWRMAVNLLGRHAQESRGQAFKAT